MMSTTQLKKAWHQSLVPLMGTPMSENMRSFMALLSGLKKSIRNQYILLTNTCRVSQPDRLRWRQGGPRLAEEDWSSSRSRSGGWADGRLRPGRRGQRLGPGRRAEGGDTPSSEWASWNTVRYEVWIDHGSSSPHQLCRRQTEHLQPEGGWHPGVQIHQSPIHHDIVDNILDVIVPESSGDVLTDQNQHQPEEARGEAQSQAEETEEIVQNEQSLGDRNMYNVDKIKY